MYQADVALYWSKLLVGGLPGVIETLGYCAAYVDVIWRTLHDAYDIGVFTFLTAAIQQASSNLQQVFSTAPGIADQAQFLSDLPAFFGMEPAVQSTLARKAAMANLRRMEQMGWVGEYGFYEAADYLASAKDRDPRPKLVRSWVAHHQGMSLPAIVNILRDGVVREWFHANPRMRSAEQLLHEKALTRGALKVLAAQKVVEAERT